MVVFGAVTDLGCFILVKEKKISKLYIESDDKLQLLDSNTMLFYAYTMSNLCKDAISLFSVNFHKDGKCSACIVFSTKNCS